MAVTFSIYAGYFVRLTPFGAKAIAVALILALSAVNYVGVREGAWVQRTFTCLKVAALLILIGAAFFSGHSAHAGESAPGQSMHFGVAMAACLMAYNGWSYVSFVAGEVRNPGRNLLRALVIGMAAVSFLYITVNLAYLKVLTIPEIAATERVGADVATRTMGSIGGTFVSLAVLLSIIGAINGCILTAARIPFAQARDGLFFARFGETHPRFQTPALAIVCGGIWTALLVITGSYETLYTYAILAAWILYHERGGGYGAAPQIAGCRPAVSHVGLPVDAVSVRSGIGVVHGGRGGDTTGSFRDGRRDCRDGRVGVLGVA